MEHGIFGNVDWERGYKWRVWLVKIGANTFYVTKIFSNVP